MLTTTKVPDDNFRNSLELGIPNSPQVSVIIPTLNEVSNLPHVLLWIPEWVKEIIIVDGQSTDGTAEIAQQLHSKVRVVQQQGRGKGSALRTGFAAATGDIIVMLDADGSTDPTEIPHYVGALVSGADFAKGSRFLQGGGTVDMPLYRKLGNLSFVLLTRLLFGGNYSDLCYGYNAFWKEVVPLLQLDGVGFEIETMMNLRALRAGLKIVEVPSFEARRVYGEGRLRAIPDGWRVLKTIFREAATHFNQLDMSSLRRRHLHDEFMPAMQMLLKEAVQISQNRDQLPQSSYETIQQQIAFMFHELLSMKVNDSEASHLQHQYKRYRGGNPWAFLDENVSSSGQD